MFSFIIEGHLSHLNTALHSEAQATLFRRLSDVNANKITLNK